MLKHKTKWCLVLAIGLVALGLIVSIGLRWMAIDNDVRGVMRSLREIDRYVDQVVISGVEQHALINEIIENQLTAIRSASQCRDLFYECEKRGRSLVYFEAQSIALFRLAEMQDDAGARILVDLLADGALEFDGEAGFNIYEALVRCGHPCLTYLSNYTGARKELALAAAKEIRKISTRPENNQRNN